MDDLEKVETIRTKCNVSYTDAKAALDAADGNVLTPSFGLSRRARPRPHRRMPPPSPHQSMSPLPRWSPRRPPTKSRAKRPTSPRRWTACGSTSKALPPESDTKFIATRRDAIILNIPILIPIVALFAWGATIWLMLIGLFFGMRYRIDSDGDVPGSINNLMDHAADAADDIKQNLNDDK